MPGGAPFSFAGLSAYNPALDITSCAILMAAAGSDRLNFRAKPAVVATEDETEAARLIASSPKHKMPAAKWGIFSPS